MNLPLWLLRLLPMWDYICPKCKREVKQKSHKCPYCNENYGIPLRVPPKVLKDPKALENYVHQHIFPKVSPLHRAYLAQFFTTIFSDGFESGDFSAWTVTEGNGSITVATDQKHHGSYAAKSVITQGQYAEVKKDFVSTYAMLFARAYVRFTTLPTSGYAEQLVEFIDSGVNVCLLGIGLGYDTAARWQTRYWKNGAYATKLSGSPATNTWYCLEIKCVISATVGEVRVYIDGAEIAALSDTSGFDNDDYGNIRYLYVGTDYWNETTFANTVWVDCVVVADTYIGEEVPPPAAMQHSGTVAPLMVM